MSSTVAICIGTYNQADYLLKAFESAVSQSYPINEIWISDDCSTDNTADVLATIQKGKWLNPWNLNIHRHDKNIGQAANLSWVLSKPKTDYIVRLDSDDIMEPNFVADLAALMDRYTSAGYGHGFAYEIDQAGNRLRERRIRRTQIYEDPIESLRAMESGYKVAANCIMYRRTALEAVNFYLPNLDWKNVEDWDMVIRITAANYGNVFSPTFIANYRVWMDKEGTRNTKRMEELRWLSSAYDNLALARYRHGINNNSLFDIRIKRAISYAWHLNEYSDKDREEYIQLLYKLGFGAKLTLAIKSAALGAGPLMINYKKLKLLAKDSVKKLVKK